MGACEYVRSKRLTKFLKPTSSTMVKGCESWTIMFTRASLLCMWFVEGLRTLGLLDDLRKNPAMCYSMFVSEERPLQAKDLCTLFEVEFSAQGSNRRARENMTICFWRDWLIDMEKGECSPVTLEKVLEFTSGASVVPPLGFPHRPQIQFLHEANKIFPEAKTCQVILRLPIHNVYDTFKKYMMEGIMQAPGFGVP
ncbi:hypothetical protein Q7C36_005189 [Tachysurus vachellii]|uniref:HECT domain-containing protein n=1 Tax=Tachysurus vachellii TaxID=175792 RepID=A0AA88NRC7_TACVA|nr:hypothetical protein Q7C36_005189 [Tachysurus vachellii]